MLLDEIAKNLPNATAIVADVTSAADCAAMVDAAHAAHGPIDIVIANAGAAESAPAGKISAEHWHRMIDVNLTGAFFTVQAALGDVMRKGQGMRRIVFTASTAGLKGYPYAAAYCAAKHGVVGLARALAVELKPSGVTVNAVCPGFTDTPLLDTAAAEIANKTGRTVSEARAALAKDNADGRLISPEEVAEKVLWLCSPAAAADQRRSHCRRRETSMTMAAKTKSHPAAQSLSKQRLRLWIRILRAARAIEVEVRERLRVEFNVTLPQFDVMAALERKPDGMTMTELSRFLMVSNGNVTGIIDRLVSDRLVARQAPADDRRAIVVRLTPRGLKEFTAMAKAHRGLGRWLAVGI